MGTFFILTSFSCLFIATDDSTWAGVSEKNDVLFFMMGDFALQTCLLALLGAALLVAGTALPAIRGVVSRGV